MSKGGVLNLDDCPPQLQKQLLSAAGVTKPRQNQFPMEQVRSNAIKVMATIANLSANQRERVLKHALKLNQV